jgi:amino acid transporter
MPPAAPGIAFAIPTYAFIVGILGMIVVGLFRLVTGTELVAASAAYEIEPELQQLGMLGVVFLGLRAFASGCTALTGVEAISNGVPAFRKPKSKNAATTLALMSSIAVTMLLA